MRRVGMQTQTAVAAGRPYQLQEQHASRHGAAAAPHAWDLPLPRLPPAHQPCLLVLWSADRFVVPRLHKPPPLDTVPEALQPLTHPAQ